MIRFEYQLVVVLLLFTTQIYGICFLDSLKSSPNTTSDQIIDQYCEYSDVKYAVNSTWNLPYPDCLTCQCNPYGLECCGYGSEAGINEPPENCQLLVGTCDVIFVQKDDPSIPCDENQWIQPIRLYKRRKFQIRRRNSTRKPPRDTIYLL